MKIFTSSSSLGAEVSLHHHLPHHPHCPDLPLPHLLHHHLHHHHHRRRHPHCHHHRHRRHHLHHPPGLQALPHPPHHFPQAHLFSCCYRCLLDYHIPHLLKRPLRLPQSHHPRPRHHHHHLHPRHQWEQHHHSSSHPS
ncbi:Os04g0636750 [Oryza sativa Japonica Group]|uniref:Os04g0636750 protein n=1 Tax=Oryza sativa subsp. japonica TaxID=39947 RepID=A0A0P0WFN1_ORYSJ|nr:hypothetical protein EE612_025806 [Oryza sativa]BAS91224.1 Os04g0636750 [Oryza sativa Japonica Group]